MKMMELEDDHIMNKMLFLKNQMKNLITKVLLVKHIKMLCSMKYAVKSYHSSYIQVQILLLKTMKNLKTTELHMF